MNGYWPAGNACATTKDVGRFALAGYHTSSCMPGLTGSLWSEYVRSRENVAMLPSTTSLVPDAPERLASVSAKVTAYTVPVEPVETTLTPFGATG